MTILDRIVADNRAALEERKRRLPLAGLKAMAEEQPPALDFAAALRGDGVSIIAEVKRASPSKGVIRQDFNPAEIARAYAEGGAAAISVLTEPRYFQGSLDYLRDIKSALSGRQIPLLRKDFITDPYQVFEARAYGADALLLIAAILRPEQLDALLRLSHELGMRCLVEVHDEAELSIALGCGAGIIGINNRDLKTFRADISTTERLRPLVPPGKITVSESGIKDRADIERLGKAGVDAVLVGEALMSAPDIAAKLKELRG